MSVWRPLHEQPFQKAMEPLSDTGLSTEGDSVSL